MARPRRHALADLLDALGDDVARPRRRRQVADRREPVDHRVRHGQRPERIRRVVLVITFLTMRDE